MFGKFLVYAERRCGGLHEVYSGLHEGFIVAKLI